MNTATIKCRVQPGKELAHGGKVLSGGTDVDLAPAVAFEVRHLVFQVTATGEMRPLGTDEQDAATLAAALASAKPHERISLLEAERAKVGTAAERLDAAIADERKRLDAEAKAAAKSTK